MPTSTTHEIPATTAADTLSLATHESGGVSSAINNVTGEIYIVGLSSAAAKALVTHAGQPGDHHTRVGVWFVGKWMFACDSASMLSYQLLSDKGVGETPRFVHRAVLARAVKAATAKGKVLIHLRPDRDSVVVAYTADGEEAGAYTADGGEETEDRECPATEQLIADAVRVDPTGGIPGCFQAGLVEEGVKTLKLVNQNPSKSKQNRYPVCVSMHVGKQVHYVRGTEVRSIVISAVRWNVTIMPLLEV